MFGDLDSGVDDRTLDVLDIDLAPLGLAGYSWSFTHDHAKWGISIDAEPGYVVVADINRQVSQERRGGGGLAFRSRELWAALKAIEVAEATVERGPHRDRG